MSSTIVLVVFVLLLCAEGNAKTYPFEHYCGNDPGNVQKMPGSVAGYSLRGVETVVRHGDRVPCETPCWANYDVYWNCNLTQLLRMDTDPSATYINSPERLYRDRFLPGHEDLPGTCGLGQLTQRGYEQHVDNGKAFRSAYVDTGFLSYAYNSSEMFLRHDKDQRTRLSLYAFIDGLYPTRTPIIGWTPVIDTWTADPTYDDMSPNTALCPYLSVLENEAVLTPSYLKFETMFVEPVLQTCREVLNDTQSDIHHIWDCGASRYCHDGGLPPGFSIELMNQVYEAQNWKYNFVDTYPSQTAHSRISIGFLTSELFQNMEKIVSGVDPTLFYFFSAHDSSISALLCGFHISDFKWPPFASTLVFEVYEDDFGAYYVRAIYNYEIKSLPCSFDETGLCPWEAFSDLCQTIIPSDPATECKGGPFAR